MVQQVVAGAGIARIGSKALIREINEALVLDVVRRHGITSRADITTATGLSAATVTGITGKLVAEGMLLEKDLLRGTGGRPARLLELGRDAVVAAGVRLSPGELEVVLVDLRGDVIATRSADLGDLDPAAAADAVAAAIEAVRAGHPDSLLRGVSIALSGVVDKQRGIVRHSGALGWEDVAFAALVSERTGAPVAIDSLVNSFTTNLLLHDQELAERDVIVLSVGTSLGASLLVRGRIHRGFGGAAGGFAHTAIDDRANAAPCHCGDSGCLETASSIWGMEREIERRGGGAVAADRDQVLQEGGRHLGIAIANAAKMFSPERVVLVMADEVRGTPFHEACVTAFGREYAHGDATAPALVTVAADSTAFARGAGYAMITELFSVDRP